jgi:ABC-type multidrug transport system ATPase subunit
VLGERAGSPRVRGRVGYVTQAPAVYDDLTAGENLEFFGALLGGGKERARREPLGDRVGRVLDTVGLGDARHQVVRTMSGGQRSRVSLATALLGDPALLVLDEPTVGLDPVLRRDLWATFHALAAAGTAILVSSHVMDEADRCDRIALLRRGRLLATGTPEELRERTGTASVEDAFLALVDDDGGTPGGAA